MQIRILQTTDSGVAGYPFVAGQVIDVEHPTPFLLSLIDGVRAEVIRQHPVTELATVEAPERAAVASPATDTHEPRQKRRHRHRVVADRRTDIRADIAG